MSLLTRETLTILSGVLLKILESNNTFSLEFSKTVKLPILSENEASQCRVAASLLELILGGRKGESPPATPELESAVIQAAQSVDLFPPPSDTVKTAMACAGIFDTDLFSPFTPSIDTGYYDKVHREQPSTSKKRVAADEHDNRKKLKTATATYIPPRDVDDEWALLSLMDFLPPPTPMTDHVFNCVGCGRFGLEVNDHSYTNRGSIPCGHYLCDQCFDIRIKKSKTCSLCLKAITRDPINDEEDGDDVVPKPSKKKARAKTRPTGRRNVKIKDMTDRDWIKFSRETNNDSRAVPLYAAAGITDEAGVRKVFSHRERSWEEEIIENDAYNGMIRRAEKGIMDDYSAARVLRNMYILNIYAKKGAVIPAGVDQEAFNKVIRGGIPKIRSRMLNNNTRGHCAVCACNMHENTFHDYKCKKCTTQACGRCYELDKWGRRIYTGGTVNADEHCLRCQAVCVKPVFTRAKICNSPCCAG